MEQDQKISKLVPKIGTNEEKELKMFQKIGVEKGKNKNCSKKLKVIKNSQFFHISSNKFIDQQSVSVI